MAGWDDGAPAAAADASAAGQGDSWSLTPDLADSAPKSADNTDPAEPLALQDDPHAEALLAALRATAPGAPLRLEGSAVQRLSMPAMQVLLAAMRETEAAGRRLVIQNPSFALSLAFEAFGFAGPDEPFTVEYT